MGVVGFQFELVQVIPGDLGILMSIKRKINIENNGG